MPTTSEIQVHNAIGKKRNNYDTTDYISGSAFAANMATAQASAADTITISVAGLGGSIFDGNQIIASIMESDKPVNAEIKGIAASMHYFMCLPCAKISATKNSWIMCHSIQGSVSGSAEDMRAEAALLEKMNGSFAELLAKRTGQTIGQVTADYLDKEVWFTAQEALDLKLIDEILNYDAEEVPEITANLSYDDAVERFTAFKKGNATAPAGLVKSITAFLTQKFGFKERSAIVLSDSDEWYLQYQITLLQSIVDSCDNILENTSTPQIMDYAKRAMTQGSADIIMLVTLLYGEEQSDAQMAAHKLEAIAKYNERVAKAGNTTGMKINMADLEIEIQAAAEQFITPKLAEKEATITALTARVNELEKKPGAKPSSVAKTQDDIAASLTDTQTDRQTTELDERNAKLSELKNFSFQNSSIS